MSFAPSGFFALRAPLLPFEVVTRTSAALSAIEATRPDALTAALAANAEEIRAAYRRLLEDSALREALFVASPDLDRALAHWHADPDGDRGQAAERALTRYLTRIASRPTPFGLFASTSVGLAGDITALTVSPPAACGRHTRLDVDYLVLLVDALTKQRDVRAHLAYRPTTSLYQAAGGWRYIETHLEDKTRSHRLVSLDRSEALDDPGLSRRCWPED